MKKRTSFLFIGISLIVLCVGIYFLGTIVIGYWLFIMFIIHILKNPEKFIKET